MFLGPQSIERGPQCHLTAAGFEIVFNMLLAPPTFGDFCGV